MHARGEQLAALAGAAGRVRDAGLAAAGRPGVVTYSRKVFIPLTRLCRDRCHYCTFATVPGRLRSSRVPVAGRGARDRPPGRGAGLQGGPVHARRPARGPLAAAREWLDAHGYDDTLAYVRAMASGCWRRPDCCRT